jgi:hypothetical protein
VGELFELIQKTYGIAGLILLAPFGTTYLLYKDNKALRKENSDLQKEHAAELDKTNDQWTEKFMAANDKVVAAQVSRVQDAQGISSKLIATVSEQSALNRETNIILDRLTDYLPKRERSGKFASAPNRRLTGAVDGGA